MSHKKAGGSSKNGRDSQAQRLGIKVYGEQAVLAGGIIVAKKAQNLSLVKMREWARTTQSSQKLQEQ